MSSPENPQFDPQLPASSEENGTPEPPVIPPAVEPLGSFQNPAVPSSPELVENPPWNGWDVLAIVGLAFLTILVSQFAILFGAHFFVYPRAPITVLAQKPLLLLVSQFFIDGIVAVFLYLLVEGKYHVRFWQAIRWNWPLHEWRWLGFGVVMLLALSMLENILPMPKDTPFDKLFARPRALTRR